MYIVIELILFFFTLISYLASTGIFFDKEISKFSKKTKYIVRKILGLMAITGTISLILWIKDGIPYVFKSFFNDEIHRNDKSNNHSSKSYGDHRNFNILIFNASSDQGLHNKFANKIKSKYPSFTITSQRDWIDKYIMDKTLIFYQGDDNKDFANKISKWLPNNQVVLNYETNPKGFFGFSKSRDLIIFTGEDLKSF